MILSIMEGGGAHQEKIGDLGQALGGGSGLDVYGIDGVPILRGGAAQSCVQEQALGQDMLGERHACQSQSRQEYIQKLVAGAQGEDPDGGHGEDQAEETEVIQGKWVASLFEQGGDPSAVR